MLLQIHQSPLEACPCLFACGLVVEDHLEHVFLEKKWDHTSLVEEQTSSWGIDLLPTQLHWHELSFKTNTLILPVSSLLAYNFLKLLTPGKALVDTLLYNSLQ